MDSSDDFEQAAPKRSKMARRRAKMPDDEVTAAGALPMPPCPLCGKVFSSGASASARSGHLGQCGRARGISTEKLIRVRRLEEKQARERMELVGSQLAAEDGEKKVLSASGRGGERERVGKRSKNAQEQQVNQYF